MPAQAQETIRFVTIIISICFSFCIPLLSFWIKKSDERLRLSAFTFISLFILNIAAAFLYDPMQSAVLFQYSNALLLLLFIAALATGNSFLVKSLTLLAPTALIVFSHFSLTFTRYPYHHNISATLVIILSIIIMYIHKSKKGTKSLLFWFVLPMLVSAVVGLYPNSQILILASPVFMLISYSILLYFYYDSFIHSLVIRAEESERKLSSIDRSVEVEVKKRMLELENMNKKLLDISKTDALSNVLNKAAILKAMDRLINDKPNSKFSILMFDIDDFKNINDTHGHFVGDKCIRTLSSTARKSFRDIDLVGRYGGDEFIIILPDTGSKQALIVAERFRKTVAESSSPSITISIGIASYPLDGTNIGNLIKVADKGLYASKKKGKNTISHNSEV